MAVVGRNQLVDAVRDKTGLPKRIVREAIGDAIDIITQAVVNGDTVMFRGIGSIRKVRRKARDPRNKDTQAKVVWGVRFHLAKKLRRAVR